MSRHIILTGRSKSFKEMTEHHLPRRGQQAAPFPYSKLISPHRTGRSAGAQHTDLQAGLVGAGAAGLILRVRQEIGAPNRIYVPVPQKQD